VNHLLKSFWILIFCFFIAQASFAHFHDQDFSKITLKTIQVSENIYMLQGQGGFAGGNLAVLVGDDGVLMVDDQLAPMHVRIKLALKELSDANLKFILNTHWHGDHTGGNAKFSDLATVVAHKNVYKRMSTDQEGFFGKTPASPKEAWPVITFDDSMNFHFNNEEIHFKHYPNGHTDGDGVVYFTKSKVIHMGDLLFTGLFPFVDLDSGGNVFNFIANIKSILDWLPEDAKVIPGHGELTDVEGLKNYHMMLVETSNYVVEQEKADKTLDEIQAKGLPEKWSSYAAGFIDSDNWIAFIYNSLEK